MRKVKLVDGTVYTVDRCGASDGRLNIRVTSAGFTIREAADKFSDPANTAAIEHYFDGSLVDHVRFLGYTVLNGLSADRAGVYIYLTEAVSGGGRTETVDELPDDEGGTV